MTNAEPLKDLNFRWAGDRNKGWFKFRHNHLPLVIVWKDNKWIGRNTYTREVNNVEYLNERDAAIGLLEWWAQGAKERLTIAKMLKEYKILAAHMAGAASAYRTYAKRSSHVSPAAETDALFVARSRDFDQAAEYALQFVRDHQGPVDET